MGTHESREASDTGRGAHEVPEVEEPTGRTIAGVLGSPRFWLAPLILVAVLDALLGMALGLFASAFARTEFQAVQFMPAFVLPQTLLCGLVIPRDQMAGWLEAVSRVLPLTYAVQGMQEISAKPGFTGTLTTDVAVIAAFTVVALLLGAATLRRRTP